MISALYLAFALISVLALIRFATDSIRKARVEKKQDQHISEMLHDSYYGDSPFEERNAFQDFEGK